MSNRKTRFNRKQIQNVLPNQGCCALALLMAGGMLIMLTGCDFGKNADEDNQVTGPTDVSVFPEMLIGARYRGRTGGAEYDDLLWTFDESKFRIIAGKSGLPSELRAALLPTNTTGYRIDGRWVVDGEVLTLSQISVDGVPIEQPPKTLRAMCTPVIRIQANHHQYLFARGTADSAWRQGPIPEWPIGTTMISSSVMIPNKSEGWLSAGYYGYSEEGELMSGSVTLRIDAGATSGSGLSPTDSARNVRLQIRKDGRAAVRCMGIPLGHYLLFAQWRDPDPREANEVIVSWNRFRLIGNFVTRWVSVAEHPVAPVTLDLVAVTRGDLAVEAPESGAYQSAFLIPWTDVDPPNLDAQQAWDLAFQLGCQALLDSGHAAFEHIPAGRYRILQVEHDELSNDNDHRDHYRVVSDETVSASF